MLVKSLGNLKKLNVQNMSAILFLSTLLTSCSNDLTEVEAKKFSTILEASKYKITIDGGENFLKPLYEILGDAELSDRDKKDLVKMNATMPANGSVEVKKLKTKIFYKHPVDIFEIKTTKVDMLKQKSVYTYYFSNRDKIAAIKEKYLKEQGYSKRCVERGYLSCKRYEDVKKKNFDAIKNSIENEFNNIKVYKANEPIMPKEMYAYFIKTKVKDLEEVKVKLQTK